MPTFAAIDIGSNSCRLAISETQGHKLRLLHQDREVVRLGESVFDTGMISPEAMANTIRALKRFQKAVQLHVVDRVRVVATSAMRDARNAAAFIAWVKSVTGWTVEVISGIEEGRLIHLGLMNEEPGARGRCLLIDLGGGSCEITLSENARIREMVSLPLGSVRLQQEFLHSDPPTRDELAQLHRYIDREIKRLVRKVGKPRVDLVIATSGTAAALAEASSAPEWLARLGRKPKRAIAAVKRAVRSRPAAVELTAQAENVRTLAVQLTKMSNPQRAAVPGIGPKRSEIIIGGSMVFAEVMERLCLKEYRYSPLGLRDGMLAQMLAEIDTRASAHKAVEDERAEGVLRVCRRYDVDLKRAEAVRSDAEKLFDSLSRVHDLPEVYREWLGAAAMMHEAGKFMSHQGHHRHTQYIIENSEIFGFSPAQRLVVSAIARYLGKSRPDPMERPFRNIPIEEHAHLVRTIVLLRLAVAMHQGQLSTMPFTVRVYPRKVLLTLHPARGGADLEHWSLGKEAGYFREVFRRDLEIEVA